MQSLMENEIMILEEDIMTVEQVTDVYMAFCLKYGYHKQAGFKDLATIEDVAILAAVTVNGARSVVGNDAARHIVTVHRATHEELDDWVERKPEAKHIFKHSFHRREGLDRADAMSLDKMNKYFARRSYELSTRSPFKPEIT